MIVRDYNPEVGRYGVPFFTVTALDQAPVITADTKRPLAMDHNPAAGRYGIPLAYPRPKATESESDMQTDKRFAMDAITGRGNPVHVIQAIRAAEDEVSPHIGSVMAMDSAAAVYKEALKRLGHDVATLPASAAQAAYRMVLRGGRPPVQTPEQREAFEMRFPNANRLKHR